MLKEILIGILVFMGLLSAGFTIWGIRHNHRLSDDNLRWWE